MANPNWKPGVSGNPNGRPPKGEALTDILNSKLDKEQIVDKMIEIAVEKEDLSAIKYIFDRLDGRPKESIEHSGDMERPVFIIEGDHD